MTKRFFNLLLLLLLLPVPIISQDINTNISPSPEKARFIVIDSVISNLSKRKLKNLCKKLNISSEGSKKQLIIRLRHFLELDKEKEQKEMQKKKDLKDVIIIERADEGEYVQLKTTDQEILTASGNVHLIYNKIRLKADKIKLNTKTKEMMCEGNVILFDGSKEITGKKIFYNLDTEYGIIYEGKSKIGRIIYKGKKIKKGKKDLYIIDKGQFTSCNEEPPHYYIEAKKIWVYPKDKIVLLDAYYVIAGVKTCWIPVYFRFEKGTGIITSWGKRKIDGWYMQNTYRYKITDYDRGNIKFDHYQRRGEYVGVDYHYSSDDSEIIASAGGAYDKKLYGDSNINPETGKMEREYRGKVSFKNRYTFNRDKENKNFNTTIRINFFRQSDYSFIQDFELYRSTRPGFHYYDKPIIYNDIYNQQENDWYINISDNRKNSSLNIKARWHFEWNPVLEEYKINTTDLPEISYTIRGTLWEPPKETQITNVNVTNTNKDKKTGFRFYPNLQYDVKLNLYHKDYYNTTTGEYLKSIDYRKATLDISRSFSFLNLFQYKPSIGLGDVAYWPYNVSESEKYNYEKQTYSYGNFEEILQLGPSSFNVRAQHNLQWRFKEPPEEDEYGKIVLHNVELSQNTTFINGLTFYASTSYDLRVKRNEKLKGIQKERFSDLNTQLNLSAIKNITISERYIYSIRNSQPLTSNLTFSYTISDFYFPFIKKAERFSANFSWNHNFPNPRASLLNINFSLNLKISETWQIKLSTHSVNERLYLYSKYLAEKYRLEETEENAGEYEHRNFFKDLLNSINIFEPSKMRKSYFKLRSANIEVTHDLHCWEMACGYTLQQRYLNYGKYTQYPYFEHSFWLRINMKFESRIGVREKLRTEPPEIIE